MVCCALFFVFSAKEAQALVVPKVSSLELENIFKEHDYENFLLPFNWRYPDIFVQTLPYDFSSIKSETEQRRFFIMILLPLSLKLNQDILSERDVVLYLNYKFQNEKLDDVDLKMIDDFALKYDVFTREKGQKRVQLILTELLLRIDVIPPSIMIAAAALNTNWGNAKFLPKSNALYRELVWYSDEGLVPEDETEETDYRIKIYPSLYQAMQAFALRLNSSVDFPEFRYLRAYLRAAKQPISGRFLVPYLLFASEIENFAGLMDYIITFYRLNEVDSFAQLRA